MAGVAAAVPDPELVKLLSIFSLLEDWKATTPKSILYRIVTFPVGKRPLLMVCIDSPELYIIVLWLTQFITPSFSRLTPGDGEVLAFTRYIQLGQLPSPVVMLPEWMVPSKFEVSWEEYMEAELSRLLPRTPRLPADTPNPERVIVPHLLIAPLSLVHPLMVAPFPSPSNVCYLRTRMQIQ